MDSHISCSNFGVILISPLEQVNTRRSSMEEKFPLRLLQSIQSLIQREGYINYKINKRVITSTGNYLGKYFEFDIQGTSNEGAKETNIFVKHIVPVRNSMRLEYAYLAEGLVYKDLSKIYSLLQDEAGVPIKERYKFVEGFEESYSEALILRNVAKEGYHPCEKKGLATLILAEIAIQEIAKFHALSFVLQGTRKAYIAEKVKELEFPLIFDEGWRTQIAGNMVDMAIKAVSHESKEKLEKFKRVFLDKYPEYINPTDLSSTRCCLCHNDFRLTNILFKKSEEQATDAIIVDYQFLRYNCPANDFLQFVFTCTDGEFRKHHLTHLKDVYYNSFRKFLKYFGIDSETIYSRKEFEDDYNKKLELGLMFAIYFLPLSLGTAPGFEDKNYMKKVDFNLDSSYSIIMQGLVDDFVEWGIL